MSVYFLIEAMSFRSKRQDLWISLKLAQQTYRHTPTFMEQLQHLKKPVHLEVLGKK